MNRTVYKPCIVASSRAEMASQRKQSNWSSEQFCLCRRRFYSLVVPMNRMLLLLLLLMMMMMLKWIDSLLLALTRRCRLSAGRGRCSWSVATPRRWNSASGDVSTCGRGRPKRRRWRRRGEGSWTAHRRGLPPVVWNDQRAAAPSGSRMMWTVEWQRGVALQTGAQVDLDQWRRRRAQTTCSVNPSLNQLVSRSSFIHSFNSRTQVRK